MTQESVISTMLEQGENQMDDFELPALYKLNEFKVYRNQIGLNMVRNKELNQ